MKTPTLSKKEVQIIHAVYRDKRKTSVTAAQIASLLKKGVIKKTPDLISGRDVHVLTPAGKRLLSGKPRPRKKNTMRVELSKHNFVAVVGTMNCSVCQKPPEHKIHFSKPMCAGVLHFEGMHVSHVNGPDLPRLCFEVVEEQGQVCGKCVERCVAYRKASEIRASRVCPHCGGEKRSNFSVDQKCYHQLTDELKIGLFMQRNEPENAWIHRYPLALAAALKFLKKVPTRKDIIDEAAKIQ